MQIMNFITLMQGKAPIRKTIYYRIPFTVYRIPNTKHRLPFTEYQTPFTVYRLPNTEYRKPKTAYRLPFNFCLYSVRVIPSLFSNAR